MAGSLLIEDVVGSKAFDQLEALELNLDAVNAQVLGLVKTFDTLGKAVESANDIRALANAQQQLNKAQTQAVELSKKQVVAQRTLSKSVEDSAKREEELQRALNKTSTSIKEARDQNKLLTAARNATNVSTKEGVEQLNRLNAKIDQNNAFIKANGDQALKQKLNIGNYASALDGLGGSFGGVVKQARGFVNMFKSMPAVLGPFAALLGSAVGALKLWTTTTARGEEVAFRFRKELETTKENFKNNAGFKLDNLFKVDDAPFKGTADALDEINDLSQKTGKSFRDWVRMAILGAAASEGALAEYGKSLKTGITLEEELEIAIKRNATTNAEYKERVKQFSQDSYDFERKRIASLTETATLERDIARLQETARDTTKSVEERQQARAAAIEKINRLEAIELGMAREQVRLIQEETELTHTAQFDALRGLDEVLAKRREEAEVLRGMPEEGEKLKKVEADIEKLVSLREQASRDILANEEKAANAAVEELKVGEKFANLRKSLSRLGKSLSNEEQTERKASFKEYTDTLKQELANQVAAAKAAADEAKAVYDAKGNEGLNQLDDVRAWIDARNAALDAEQNAEEELVRKSAQKEIELLGLTGDEAAKVTEKMEADLLAIQEKYGIKREALVNDNARQAAEAVAGQIQAEQVKITNDIQSELDARQVDLSKALEDGKITYRQYHKAIRQSEKDALRQRLKAQIEYYEKVMEAEGVSVAEQRKALSELARLYKDFGKEINEDPDSPSSWWDGMTTPEKIQAVVDKVKETWDAVQQIVQQSIQNQIAAVDNQQKKVDKAYNKRLEQVKNMGLTARQEDAETARIEKEHAAETEKLEEQKAALEAKQAKWNKANSIIQATISGAVAITQAFAQAGPIAGAVFAGIIAATTAAQIAVIASQKIPEYREGRDGGPAELAIVGDGGVPEVVQTRGGKAYITPPTPTLTRLEAGDKVYRNVEEYLMSRDGGGDRAAGELRQLRKERRESDDQMITAMMNMNAKLSVTSAGLAWLRGGKGVGDGRG